MRNKGSMILLAALGLLLTGSAARTQEPSGEPPDPDQDVMGEPGPMPGGGMPDLRQEIGLTDDQMTQLRALRMKAYKENLRGGTDLQLRRLDLEELLEADTPDKAAIDKAIRALAETQQGVLRQRVDHRLAFRNVLTAEQRTKLRGLVERRGAQMRGRGFGGRGMHGWARPEGSPRGGGRGFGPGRGFGRGFGQGCEGERGFGPGRGPGFGPGGRFGPPRGGDKPEAQPPRE